MVQFAIEVRDVKHRYKDREVLHGINLEIGKGEIFSLLGPNGGGKSTLFKLIATLLALQEGDIFVEGQSLRGCVSLVRRKLGVVFQSPSLDKKLTVLENLRYHAAFYGLGSRQVSEKIDEELRRFSLADRANERVEKLSGGLQRRVELAKVLLSSPSILLLDEPTTGLDPGVRMTLWQDLRKLQEEQKLTILFTTHLMEEAEIADQVAILDQGTRIACGAPSLLKSEVAVDLLRIKARSIEEVEAIIKALEARNPPFYVERHVFNQEVVARVFKEDASTAPQQMIELANQLADRIDSISLSRPTMADVYFSKTGKLLQTEPSI